MEWVLWKRRNTESTQEKIQWMTDDGISSLWSSPTLL